MHELVFLFDVDNTLIDNDRVQADLRDHLAETYGETARERYWAIFEELRSTHRLCRLSRSLATLSARGDAQSPRAADRELAR